MSDFDELIGNDIPYHLRADAQHLGACDRCGRKTWGPEEISTICTLPQPCGHLCGGRIVPPESSGDKVLILTDPQ